MTATKDRISLPRVVAQMKAEVLYDMSIGRVPETVSRFSELHDYVDANCYGGFCDDHGITDLLIEEFGGRDENEGMPDGALKFMNDAQGAIDEWLQEFSSGARVARENSEYVYVQLQAPAGNWVDSIGTQSVEAALVHKQRAEERGEKARIVVKSFAVIG